MRKFAGLLIVCALLCIGQAASADPYEDGLAASQRGDYSTALKIWLPLAERGNVKAQAILGLLFTGGIGGVAQDYKEAVKWYRLAADQGDAKDQADAQFNLGVMYRDGQGIARNYKESVKWFRRAAEQQHARAQNNLGVMFAAGQGIAQDYIRAHMWFNLAAASLSGEDGKNATDGRNTLAARMTSAQIAQAQEMARKCQQSKFKDCGW